RLRGRDERGRHDRGDVQIGRARRGRTDTDRFIGEVDRQAVRVGLAVHGDRLDTELAAGADDAHGDLAAIRDEDLLEPRHGRRHRLGLTDGLREREAISLAVDRGRQAYALARAVLGLLRDLPAGGLHRVARRLEIVDVEAEPGVARLVAPAVVKRDRRAVGAELRPERGLILRGETEGLAVEVRAARDVGGHDHEVRLRDLHRDPPPVDTSGTAARSVPASATFAVTTSGRIRLARPVSTVPGPNSTNADGPSPAARRLAKRHCNGDHPWRYSSPGRSRACSWTLPSTFVTIG